MAMKVFRIALGAIWLLAKATSGFTAMSSLKHHLDIISSQSNSITTMNPSLASFHKSHALRYANPLFSVVSSDTVDTEQDEENVTSKGLLKRDRYVATNRFAVRKGKAAKFEARWANRKSRLSELQGFKYFHLMRRVELNEDGTCTYSEGDKSDGTNMGNYVSFTIWEKKSDFSAWRKGEAFKEAHGGTSIGAFMSTMISSAFILAGPPRPAFYDGLLVQSVTPENVPETVDGWRNVQADGVTTLPEECFVACNQFFVPSENAASFEKRWADRESKLKECDGFVAFTMLRRDNNGKGHGVVPMDEATEPTYMSATIWKDRASFDKWRKGNAFQKAHGDANSKPTTTSEQQQQQQQQGPLWSQPPKPIFYEGTLVISKPEGA
mmetsp:Transcript_2656/g.4955  ORF Transcript_2656/g.4955 Transcript_2656/m.4955 type:complete len:381 (-) Transcript_2656:67-1209(-)